MGTFSASLRAIGDVNSLAATVELADGRINIVAGDTEIGTWPLTDIELEEIPTGYRMSAEGEQILIELKDVGAFTTALNTNTKKRTKLWRKKDSKKEARQEPAPSATATVETDERPPTVNAPTAPTKDPEGTSPTAKLFDLVDRLLIRAKKRLGPYLPDWLFSRAMFFIIVSLLVVAVFFPGPSSTALLVGGVLLLLFGAVTYSDAMLASRWLPGRSTPQQALLAGLAIFLLGVLLGVVAH